MNIKAIQEALLKAGFDPGPIDGDMGPRTREALREFQRKHYLVPDGIVGPKTIAVLQAIGGVEIVKPNPEPGEARASRRITMLVWHCTATREGQFHDRKSIDAMHRANGWSGIGYHKLILLDGAVQVGRPENRVGAHVANFNANSLGFSYVGGLDRSGKPKDTRTDSQKVTMRELTQRTLEKYPSIKILCGHRDLSPDKDGDGVVESHEWIKVCPCFDVSSDYGAMLRGR